MVSNMKKFSITLIGLLLVLPVFSQGVIKDFDTKKFPEVTFSLQYNNPVVLQADAFTIEEEGIIAKDIQVTLLETQVIPEKTNVLVLWDYRGKEEFVPILLQDLFGQIKAENLYINVALLRRDEKGSPVYERLLESFTDDRTVVVDRVKAKQEELLYSSRSKYRTKASDIIWALPQAIEQLYKQPNEDAKAVLLFTDGKNNTDTGNETMPIVAASKEKRVPIYIVNIAGDEAGITFSENLSKRTFGEFLSSEGSFKSFDERRKLTEEQRKARGIVFNFTENETISEWLKGIAGKWVGNSYRVSFKSHFDRVGQLKQVRVRIGDDTFNASYNVPGFSFAVWIKENLILFLILLVVLLGGVGIGLFFLIRHIRDVAADKKEEKEKQETERKRLKTEQETLRRKLDIAESEQRRRLEEERKKENEAKRQEYLSSINSLMRARNIKARVLISTMTGSFEYLVNSAETTIGSSDDNDIVIDDRTVSRHHAILYFNGENFGIRDLKSTNGIVINGFKMDDMKLRNGDSVSLGNTVIKIYF